MCVQIMGFRKNMQKSDGAAIEGSDRETDTLHIYEHKGPIVTHITSFTLHCHESMRVERCQDIMYV